MLPPEIRSDTPSAAERRMFEILARELGNDWTVLHSLGLASHSSKPWAEIDFVLVGPPGVICLEVKGGRISRKDGRWGFTDRKGQTNYKEQGPFEQVGGATAALFKHLRSQFPWIGNSVVIHGVVFPDIEFRENGPDIDTAVVYDARDTVRPFSAFLRRLTDHWYARLESTRSQPIETLSDIQKKIVVQHLRGDFDYRPSLASRIDHSVQELIKLTEEQYMVLDGLKDNPRVLVNGGAGTGKTLLALEEARRMALGGNRVLVCCFNKNLAGFLSSTTSDLEGITVQHIHGLTSYWVHSAQLQGRLPNAQQEDLFDVFYPELAVEALIQEGRFQQAYDVLIVDEGQDLLLETFLDVFDALLVGGLSDGRWRVFLDPNQNIYEKVHPKGMLRLQATSPANYRLTVNCRNTKPIGISNSMLSGIDSGRISRVEGPEVELEWYQDERQQKRQVTNAVRRLLGQGVAPNQIVLLSKRRLENSCLQDRAWGIPFPIEIYMHDASHAKTIRFSTIQGFKGLEAEAVMLLDIDDLERVEALMNLYVGISRTRAHLTLFIAEDQRNHYEMRAYDFGQRMRNNLLP